MGKYGEGIYHMGPDGTPEMDDWAAIFMVVVCVVPFVALGWTILQHLAK